MKTRRTIMNTGINAYKKVDIQTASMRTTIQNTNCINLTLLGN